MALPKQEPFTAADQNLVTYNASWVENGGGFRIVSNQCDSKAGRSGNMQHWEGDGVPSNTHYAKATIKAYGAPWGYIGVAVRCASASDEGYYLFAFNSESYIGTNISGSYIDIGGERGPFAVNDILELRASATGKLQIFKNGSQVGTDILDTTYSAGYFGLSAYDPARDSRIDDWEGGNLGGASAAWLQRNYWWDNY